MKPLEEIIDLVGIPNFLELAVDNFDRLADTGLITFDYTPNQPILTRILSRLTDFPPPPPFQVRPLNVPEINKALGEFKSRRSFRIAMLPTVTLFSRTIPLSYFFSRYKILDIPRNNILFHYKKANHWLIYSGLILFGVFFSSIIFFSIFLLIPILVFTRGIFFAILQ